MNFEFTVLDFIQNNIRNGVLDVIMPAISSLGNAGAIWIVSGIGCLINKKTRKTGTAIMSALALDVLTCNVILKPFVARIRPCDVNMAVKLLVSRPTDYSFPSGHTAAAFAAASAIFFSTSGMKNRKLQILIRVGTLALATLIAFSRLYLYVHYPTDVIAGAMLGIMLGWCGYEISTKIGEKLYEDYKTDF